MAHTTPQRTVKTRTQHQLSTPPPSPTVNKEITLHDHLQASLDGLPQDLPTYYQESLLDDLCFLLTSPLFLYAMSPRIRQGNRTPASSAHTTTPPRPPIPKETHRKPSPEPTPVLDTAKLHIDITHDDKGWATRLLYSTIPLIEGRELRPPNDTGFVPSFRFFCEEAAFLGCEFRARERAARGLCGEWGEEGVGKRREDKRRRRLVKLKVRFRMVRGRAVRVREKGRGE